MFFMGPTRLSGGRFKKGLPTLPVEVWERILDWLVVIYTPVRRTSTESTLPEDLLSCALVCRAWRPRAQTHLFAYPRIKACNLPTFETAIRKIPVLCSHVQEFIFENEPIGTEAKSGVVKTVDTLSHVTRVAHKFPNVHYFLFQDNDLSVEHPYLSRSIAACRRIDWLDFFTSVPTRLHHLARFLAAFRNLTIVSLAVPILSEPDITTLSNHCNVLKSSPDTLVVYLEQGSHLLLNWLVKSKTFVKSLQRLGVIIENRFSSQEITLHAENLQKLLNFCCKHLKVWDFYRCEDIKSMPPGNVPSISRQRGLYIHLNSAVSLHMQTSLVKAKFKVSISTFQYALHQLQTVTSKKMTKIVFLVDSPSRMGRRIRALWKQLDDTLSAEPYATLTMVQVGYLELDEDDHPTSTDQFNDAEGFPKLLPTLYSRRILTWNHEPDLDLTFF